MKYLLALDIGTTSVKAGLFDSDGVCRATALEEYRLITPSADQAELDPETYWTASSNTLQLVIDRAKVETNLISVLTVSSQGETLIPVDQDGNPVRNAIVWMDNRAVSQAEFLKQGLGPTVYDVTGIPEIVPTWPACKILWMKENEPENYQRTAKFLLVQDYLVYCLAGKFVTNGSISCTTLLFDIVHHGWWKKALDAIGITEEKLPTIQKAGSIVGKITPQTAQALGLSTNVFIVCGGMDQCVGAIGAGNIDEGVVSETTGAALALQVSIRNPLIDPSRTTPVYVHSVNERYLFVPVCPTAGMAFKWFKDNFVTPDVILSENEKNIDYYDLMNEMVEQVPAGCDGLVMIPHLMGAFSPESNPFARGSFTGFTLHHRKDHFVRAIQEAVAFMLRQNIEAVQRAGVKVQEIRTSGGASRSQVWNQIKADVCSLPIVKLENEDTGLVGDAILGGVATGLFFSIEDACQIMVHTSSRVEPTDSTVDYNKFYQRYIDLDKTLKEYFKRNYSG
jgi:xylulokinase